MTSVDTSKQIRQFASIARGLKDGAFDWGHINSLFKSEGKITRASSEVVEKKLKSFTSLALHPCERVAISDGKKIPHDDDSNT